MIGQTAASSLVLAALLTPLGGPAHRKTEAGNEHYLAGDLDLALAQYTEAQVAAPDAAELHYDIGNVLYRQGEYDGAAEAYERALASAGPALRPLAAYNLGNARFQQREFSKAAENYRRALEEIPTDADAKRNLELALRALEQQPRSQPESKPEEDKQDEQQPSSPPSGSPSPSPSSGPEKPSSSPSPSSGPGKPGGSPSPRPGEMTAEQAARLLDGAADSERDAQRKQAELAARSGEPAREKDW